MIEGDETLNEAVKWIIETDPEYAKKCFGRKDGSIWKPEDNWLKDEAKEKGDSKKSP